MHSSALPASRARAVAGVAPAAAPRAGTRKSIATSAIKATSSNDSADDRSRRDVLATGLTAALASFALSPSVASAAEGESKKGTMTLPVGSLSTFQKKAIRNEFLNRSDAALREVLTGDDARVALRLVLHDAGTYDAVNKTGGLDASVILDSEEANRPENKEFAPYVAKLRKAKEVIDAQARPGQAKISWTDLEVLGARAALRKSFGDAKFARSVTKSADGKGDEKARSFGANDFPVVFGRTDGGSGKGSAAGPAGKLPPPDADAETVINFFAGLGSKPNKGGTGGFGPALPLFWARPAFLLWSASVPAEISDAIEQKLADANPAFADAKKYYDRSRATFSRAGYEIDLAEALFNLSSGKCGAKFDQDAYLYDIEIETVKIS